MKKRCNQICLDGFQTQFQVKAKVLPKEKGMIKTLEKRIREGWDNTTCTQLAHVMTSRM